MISDGCSINIIRRSEAECGRLSCCAAVVHAVGLCCCAMPRSSSPPACCFVPSPAYRLYALPDSFQEDVFPPMINQPGSLPNPEWELATVFCGAKSVSHRGNMVEIDDDTFVDGEKTRVAVQPSEQLRHRHSCAPGTVFDITDSHIMAAALAGNEKLEGEADALPVGSEFEISVIVEQVTTKVVHQLLKALAAHRLYKTIERMERKSHPNMIPIFSQEHDHRGARCFAQNCRSFQPV